MARTLKPKNPNLPDAVDITHPWKKQFFKCKDIDPAKMEKPFSKDDFMRKPDIAQIPHPSDKNVKCD